MDSHTDESMFEADFGGAGSVNNHDAYLTYTVEESGLYYFAATAYPRDPSIENSEDFGSEGFEESGTYTLNVSIDSEATDFGTTPEGWVSQGLTGADLILSDDFSGDLSLTVTAVAIEEDPDHPRH